MEMYSSSEQKVSLLIMWVFLDDFLQHIDFKLGCFPVFLQVLNNLQSYLPSTSVRLKDRIKNNPNGTNSPH